MTGFHLAVRFGDVHQRVGGPNGNSQLARDLQVGEPVQQRRGPIGA